MANRVFVFDYNEMASKKNDQLLLGSGVVGSDNVPSFLFVMCAPKPCIMQATSSLRRFY